MKHKSIKKIVRPSLNQAGGRGGGGIFSHHFQLRRRQIKGAPSEQTQTEYTWAERHMYYGVEYEYCVLYSYGGTSMAGGGGAAAGR